LCTIGLASSARPLHGVSGMWCPPALHRHARRHTMTCLMLVRQPAMSPPSCRHISLRCPLPLPLVVMWESRMGPPPPSCRHVGEQDGASPSLLSSCGRSGWGLPLPLVVMWESRMGPPPPSWRHVGEQDGASPSLLALCGRAGWGLPCRPVRCVMDASRTAYCTTSMLAIEDQSSVTGPCTGALTWHAYKGVLWQQAVSRQVYQDHSRRSRQLWHVFLYRWLGSHLVHMFVSVACALHDQ